MGLAVLAQVGTDSIADLQLDFLTEVSAAGSDTIDLSLGGQRDDLGLAEGRTGLVVGQGDLVALDLGNAVAIDAVTGNAHNIGGADKADGLIALHVQAECTIVRIHGVSNCLILGLDGLALAVNSNIEPVVTVSIGYTLGDLVGAVVHGLGLPVHILNALRTDINDLSFAKLVAEDGQHSILGDLGELLALELSKDGADVVDHAVISHYELNSLAVVRVVVAMILTLAGNIVKAIAGSYLITGVSIGRIEGLGDHITADGQTDSTDGLGVDVVNDFLILGLQVVDLAAHSHLKVIPALFVGYAGGFLCGAIIHQLQVPVQRVCTGLALGNIDQQQLAGGLSVCIDMVAGLDGGFRTQSADLRNVVNTSAGCQHQVGLSTTLTVGDLGQNGAVGAGDDTATGSGGITGQTLGVVNGLDNLTGAELQANDLVGQAVEVVNGSLILDVVDILEVGAFLDQLHFVVTAVADLTGRLLLGGAVLTGGHEVCGAVNDTVGHVNQDNIAAGVSPNGDTVAHLQTLESLAAALVGLTGCAGVIDHAIRRDGAGPDRTVVGGQTLDGVLITVDLNDVPAVSDDDTADTQGGHILLNDITLLVEGQAIVALPTAGGVDLGNQSLILELQLHSLTFAEEGNGVHTVLVGYTSGGLLGGAVELISTPVDLGLLGMAGQIDMSDLFQIITVDGQHIHRLQVCGGNDLTGLLSTGSHIIDLRQIAQVDVDVHTVHCNRGVGNDLISTHDLLDICVLGLFGCDVLSVNDIHNDAVGVKNQTHCIEGIDEIDQRLICNCKFHQLAILGKADMVKSIFTGLTGRKSSFRVFCVGQFVYIPVELRTAARRLGLTLATHDKRQNNTGNSQQCNDANHDPQPQFALFRSFLLHRVFPLSIFMGNDALQVPERKTQKPLYIGYSIVQYQSLFDNNYFHQK